jgi:pimeloyl-ACP methyl ester carboxylesterase
MRESDHFTATMADGAKIYLTAHGDRTNPAIFMGPHFYMSRSLADPAFVDEWVSGLREDFFLITADYPRGIGRTPNSLGRQYSPDIAAEECGRIADAAGVDRFGWLGYSFGGAMGVQIACRTGRVMALAVGGFPPLNAPFKELVDILERATCAGEVPSGSERGVLLTALGFYLPLLDWAERDEINKLAMPCLAFMGEMDMAQGLPHSATVPLAAILRGAAADLVALGWQIEWLGGHDHASAVRAPVALPLVRKFFLDSLAR